MSPTKASGWGWMLFRATLIGTVLQLGLTISGHYDASIKNMFGILGMFLSLVAGFVFGRIAGSARMGIVIVGGAFAGALCALIAILESYILRDVPAWVIAFGPFSSAITGGLGGILGRLARPRT
jgi:hypothetical protein